MIMDGKEICTSQTEKETGRRSLLDRNGHGTPTVANNGKVVVQFIKLYSKFVTNHVPKHRKDITVD